MPFTPRQQCVVDALGRVAWAAWDRAAAGRANEALEYLDVFRGLYNFEIRNLTPGLTPATASALPASIDAAQWDAPMVRSVAAMVALALINADARPAVEAIRSMPRNLSEVGAWFTSTMRPVVPASAAAALGRYAGRADEVLFSVSRSVKEDLRACDAEILAPRKTEAQAAAAMVNIAESPDYDPSAPSETPAPPASNNTLLFAGAALLVAVLWASRRS
jgi:hypothetical protein